MNPNDLVSWDTYKAIHGVDDDLRKEFEPIITTCSRRIQKWTGRKFVYGNYIDFHHGTYDTELIPNETPIISITGMWVDKLRDFEDISKVDIEDYKIIDDKIFSNNLNVGGRSVIKLQYEAGYIVPTYERESAPPSPQDGEYWWDTLENALKVWETDTWNSTTIEKITEDVQVAVVEYVIYSHSKYKSSGVGVEQAGQTKAGQTNWEKKMPESVRVKLRTYKKYL